MMPEMMTGMSESQVFALEVFMRNKKALAKAMVTMLALCAVPTMTYASSKAYSVDMTDYNDEAWANVAMANDDTVTSGVYIRSSMDASGTVVGYLYRGGAVTVLDKGDTWTEIQSGDVTGYIQNTYLVYGTEAKGLAEYYGSYGVKASWDDVNVFAKDSALAKIVGTADDGDVFPIVSVDGHWIEIQNTEDSTAYVSSEDVKQVMLMNSAVAVDDEDSNAAAKVFSAFKSTSVSTAQSAVQETDTSEISSYTAGAEATAYTESTDYSEETWQESAAEETYAETEASWQSEIYEETEAYYAPETETSAAQTDYTYTAPSTDGMSLSEKADALYKAYLTAQEAADNAVANGADEQTIIDTAKAAQDAYGVYVAAQNAADQEKWGYSATETEAQVQETEPAAADSTSETTVAEENDEEDVNITETVSDEDVQPVTEAPAETEAQVSSSDLELLAALIYCEAGNQPYEGQVAVGAVVMNRIASGSFPNTVSDVIYQSGQFTPAYSGALASALANGSGSGYLDAASAAMAGQDPTGGALYFNTSHGSGVLIGAHWFY